MKRKNRWVLAVLTGCLLGAPIFGSWGWLHAAPAKEVAAASKVSVNQADATELESIRGIGPMLAQRIIKYREANGRFEHLEDLVQVPGIGPAKFEKLKDQVTL